MLSNGFPTGYNAYYLMKYELSPAGYRGFLDSSASFLPDQP